MYFHNYHHLLKHSNSSESSSFWGAFWGAAFAFMFGLIAFYIQKKMERSGKHRNALVKLEQWLHEVIDETNINLQHAKTSSSIFSQTEINSTDYRFNLFEIPSDVPLELSSLDMINKCFEYSRSLSRINVNMEAKNRALTRVEDSIINGVPIAPQSKSYISSSMADIQVQLVDNEEEALELLSYVVIYLSKAKEKIYFLKGTFFNKWDLNISQETLLKVKNNYKKTLSDKKSGSNSV
jgi:hypothetical protein